MPKVIPDDAENPFIESSTLLTENEVNQVITNAQSIKKSSKKSRTIIWYMVFTGFLFNYMVKCNTNIAIVGMVMPRKSSNSTQITVSECFNHSALLLQNEQDNNLHNNETFKKRFSIERSIMDLFQVQYNERGFEWNEYQQGLLLSSYYWFSIFTHLPGGYLAKRHGTKLVFGLSNFLAAGSSFLIPMAAYINFNFLLIMRTTQGILSGFCWPAMNNLIAQWVPPNERSRFTSAFIGGSVGIAIFYPIFGFIMSNTSWEWIYHFTTVCTILWFICWQYFVYDSPAQHPRIEESEFNYITESLCDSVQCDKKAEIPWKAILTSIPFWLTVLAQWGQKILTIVQREAKSRTAIHESTKNFVLVTTCYFYMLKSGAWAIFTFMIQLPTYLKFIHGFDNRMSGILAGLPHILRMIFSYTISMYVDYLLKTEKMTRTNVRKFAVFINCVVSGLLTIGSAYSGCNYVISLILIYLSILSMGAQASGPLASLVDLGPNYSSILLGIATTVTILPGAISSYIVGVLTLNNQTVQQWKYVFLISAGVSIVSGAIYIFFGSSDEQYWNKPPKMTEMKRLANKPNRKRSQ